MNHYQTKQFISEFFDLLSDSHTLYFDLLERFLIDSLENPCDNCTQTPVSSPPNSQNGKF